MIFRSRGTVAALLLIAAPACAGTIVEERGLSDYVQGRHASAIGELGRAATEMEVALGLSPNDPHLLRTAFDFAVAAGDEGLAVGTARRLAAVDRFDSGVALLLAADAVKRRNWKAMDTEIEAMSETGFAKVVSPILRAWAFEAQGKTSQARAALGEIGGDSFARNYLTEHRAHIAAATRDWDTAAAAYRQLIEGDEGRNVRARLALAGVLQRRGQEEQARLALADAQKTPEVLRAQAAFADGKKLTEWPEDARAGVATMMARMAADLTRERTVPLALVLARAATWLDPENGNGWLLVSQLLQRSEQYEAALAAARQVPPGDALAGYARGQEAALLIESGEEESALGLLKVAANAPAARAEDWIRLGDALGRAERHRDAAAAYGEAIERQDEDSEIVWQLHFLRGASLEQAGDWETARPILERALELDPDQAVTLNYLGYALLDRGERQDEAIKLIEKAHRLEPDDGHITDSLGWAQYRLGDYETAVKTLERAIADVPGDPTINEHLGDAYWQVGRRLEARYRWRAALGAEPGEEAKTRLEAKLDFGFERAVAMLGGDPARP